MKKESILLVLRLSSKRSNLDMKYMGIIKALRRCGLDVWYTLNDNGCVCVTDGETKIKIGKQFRKLNTLTRNTALFRSVKNYIKKADKKFDYCYIRSVPPVFWYKAMLKAIKASGAKIAIEIPTYPSTTEVETETFVRKHLLKLFRKRQERLAKYTDVYLPMGEKTEEIYKRPALNIENGVDTDFLNMREYKPKGENEIHMLAVAKFARWHGYDRVIDGMKLYYEKKPKKKVYFHLVGPDGDGALEAYKEKIEKYKLSQYVILEGPKYGAEADEYFNMADIAVASINIRGMKAVYPLKIVEYIARGIPFIYAKSQCQVRDDWEFCMSVPTDGTPIDIDEIVRFSDKVKSFENISETMREIAKTDCSWDKQMNKVLEYFRRENK